MTKKRTGKDTALYKFKDHKLFLNEIQRYGTLKNFALACDINVVQIGTYVNNDECSLIGDNAHAIANTLRVNFDELFILSKQKQIIERIIKIDKDKSDLEVSEEIITGIKRNIEHRLSITHDKEYVKRIMDLVDDLVIESSYLGVNCQRDDKADFIVKAIQKRRTTI
jgi:hypothetical protein